MNSEIIKCVAGAGKTTWSINFLSKNKNGLYLAFTKSVVKDVYDKGFLSKTIDSFFFAYIIPKFMRVIPIIGNGAQINYIEKEHVPKNFLGIMNIHIDAKTGNILNKTKQTGFSLNSDRKKFFRSNNKNKRYLNVIFREDSLNLTDSLRNELSEYILLHFSEHLVKLIRSRFSYVIIDEAQDLNGYKELFADVLVKSDIKVLILGDENQSIMGGAGGWFKSKKATKTKNKSKRSPESICSWIRENLDIEIYGVEELDGQYCQIDINDVETYDNGSRILIYNARSGKYKKVIDLWTGPKYTIKTVKGSTIEEDIVVIGKKLSRENLYTALTRTRRSAYSTIEC